MWVRLSPHLDVTSHISVLMGKPRVQAGAELRSPTNLGQGPQTWEGKAGGLKMKTIFSDSI